MRHPIYSGLMVALAGTAIYLGEWRGLIALPVFGVGFWVKAVREEALLESEFGEDYRIQAPIPPAGTDGARFRHS